MKAITKRMMLPVEIDERYLQTQGNIDTLQDQYAKTYQYIRRSVEPAGFFTHQKLVLKLYHMKRETEPLPQNLQDSLQSYLLEEVEQGRIDTKQSMGFAILSQGFLSINIWGRGNVLFTQTYTVENSFPALSPKTLEQTGVACTWEIRIMQYEYNLWHRYLETKRTIENKRTYLESFLSGDLF
jgi:hypothetical protein